MNESVARAIFIELSFWSSKYQYLRAKEAKPINTITKILAQIKQNFMLFQFFANEQTKMSIVHVSGLIDTYSFLSVRKQAILIWRKLFYLPKHLSHHVVSNAMWNNRQQENSPKRMNYFKMMMMWGEPAILFNPTSVSYETVNYEIAKV